jgi:cell pole-organizing protein PopZ
MSGSQTPPAPGGATPPPGGDPSMEDILASIRRILSEDEALAPNSPATEEPHPHEDVLVLDPAMMVPDPANEALPLPESVPLPTPEPPVSSSSHLIAPETEAAAASSVGGLVRTLTERGTRVHSGGPTIEDIVREEIRPLLKSWLDANLPPLVERLVRAEIERVVGRAVS